MKASLVGVLLVALLLIFPRIPVKADVGGSNTYYAMTSTGSSLGVVKGQAWVDNWPGDCKFVVYGNNGNDCEFSLQQNVVIQDIGGVDHMVQAVWHICMGSRGICESAGTDSYFQPEVEIWDSPGGQLETCPNQGGPEYFFNLAITDYSFQSTVSTTGSDINVTFTLVPTNGQVWTWSWSAPSSTCSFSYVGLSTVSTYEIAVGPYGSGYTTFLPGTEFTVENAAAAFAWNEYVGTSPSGWNTDEASNLNFGDIVSSAKGLSYDLGGLCGTSKFSVTVQASGDGTTKPSGTKTYACGATIQLSALPAQYYSFGGWSSSSGWISLANASSNSTTATIYGAGTITASFGIPKGGGCGGLHISCD